MTDVFDAYARFYDLLYQDKDYASEAEYVDRHIREHAPGAARILDLGCGSGAHDEHLARMGYTVHGVDLSEKMIALAESRRSALPPEVAERLKFDVGDLRTVRTGETYDAVVSLFHVMSYQTANLDLVGAFETAASHLQPKGIFLFDFWYGPAVLAQQPEVRVMRLENDEIAVTRIAEPTMHAHEKVVDVSYTVLIKIKKTEQLEEVRENHRMRYLFLPELELLASTGTWKGIQASAWMSQEPPGRDDWSAFAWAVRV